MPRRKKPTPELNVWQQFAAEHFRPSYNRDAGRILYGRHDVEKLIPVPAQDANGNLVAIGWEVDIVPDPRLVRWIDALMAFDDRERHDKTLLIELLVSDYDLPPIVCSWLADLLSRYELRKIKGMATSYEQKVLALLKVLDVLPDAWGKLLDLMPQRLKLAAVIERFNFIIPSHHPRDPVYDLSEIETRLYLAAEMVRDLKPARGKLDEAITVAAAKYKLEKITLINYRNGRRGSTRRIKARNTRP